MRHYSYTTFLEEKVHKIVTAKKMILPIQFGFQPHLAAVQGAANLCRQQRNTVLLDIEKAYVRVWRDGLLQENAVVGTSKVDDLNYSSRLGTDEGARNTSFQVRCGKQLYVLLPKIFRRVLLISFSIFVADLPTFTKDNSTKFYQFADDTTVEISDEPKIMPKKRWR